MALQGLRGLAAHGLQLARLRAELAAEELDAARAQWLRWVALAVLAAALAALTLLAIGAAVAVALWPALGWPVLLVVAAAYGLAAWALLGWLQRDVQAAPPLLAVTRRELARDLALLQGGREEEGTGSG